MKTKAATNALLVESARWRLLGLLFERPRTGWHEEVRALSAEVDDERLVAAAREAARVREGEYHAVMGPGGAVTPREVGYRPMGDPGRILSGLGGFYAAFGFDPRAEDPADHVAVQAGFVGFMKLKQAYAAARGDDCGERMAADALRTFVEDHLAGFAGALARRMETAGAPGYLTRAASLLREWCPGDPLAVVERPAAAPGDDGSFVCGRDCSG